MTAMLWFESSQGVLVLETKPCSDIRRTPHSMQLAHQWLVAH